MISSDLEELIGICDRILVMNQGEIREEVGAPHRFDRERILALRAPRLTPPRRRPWICFRISALGLRICKPPSLPLGCADKATTMAMAELQIFWQA